VDPVSAVLEYALRYASDGRPVFPCNGKRPYVARGLHDATTDSAMIEGWWERWPDANIAIATGSVSGLLVVDVDDLDALHELEREYGELPRTASVTTPRGGQHYWFRHAGGAVPSSAGKVASGIDIRADGGYVIAPPSTGYVVDEEAPLAEPPEWLMERMRSSSRNGKAPRIGNVIPAGRRNAELTSLAGTMRRRGMGEAEIAAALEVANRERCQPQLAEQEVADIAASVARYKPAEPPASLNGDLPARGEIDTAELLDDVREFVTRFVVLPTPAAADLLALWVLHTHAFEAFWATPYLRVVSAAPDSGKSLLMEVLSTICRRGWYAINPSVAVLYRKVDRDTPTLLLDEMDNYPVDERRDALAVLNGGYKRGATVDRCKENGDLVSFNAFCPKGYAGLDNRQMVPTLLSRSITLRMERKTATERAEMWIAPLVEPEAAALRERCQAWGEQNLEALATHRPDLLGLFNRAAEVWWALLAIAEHAAGEWPARARVAASEFTSGGDDTDDVPDQVQLLLDIRAAFGDELTISTSSLLASSTTSTRAPGAPVARARVSTRAGWRGCCGRSRSGREGCGWATRPPRATTSTSSRMPSPGTSQKRNKRNKCNIPLQA
jgi:bifunctional DNA primase/polymerase-like protein/uncharacterized protein DUF3631/primase-like protein